MYWLLAVSLGLLAYLYAGYPLLIWALSRTCGKPVQKAPFTGGMSILIAAHNEATALPRKVENLLALARREPIREIWIGLDGCTDGTGEATKERIQNSEFRIQNEIHQPPTTNHQPIPMSNIQYPISNVPVEAGYPRSEVRGPDNQRPTTNDHQPTVHILEFESRRGKAAVLNDLMARAGQSIFVMMDARQQVEEGAIPRLLEHFADPQVGVVSGAMVYESAEGAAQKGAQSYWGYETFIRRCESQFWAVPGATGALYAIRRELCRPIPDNTLVDDVLIPMRAVLNGYRCLFEPLARVVDRPTADFEQENIRKRRTLTGVWQLISIEPKIYGLFTNPIWFQWISHKFLRLLTPFLVGVALVAAGGMENWTDGILGWAGVLFWMIWIAIVVSGLCYWAGRHVRFRFLGLLGAFLGVNQALVLAAWDAGRGRFEARWQKGGGR
jgi:poly-beta-1,6-N-acetyl-D-glucosamine synthase